MRTTTENLEYQMTYPRAVEAAIWGMPAVSMAAFRKHIDELGARFNEVVYFSKPLEPRHELLTANNQTPYVMSVLDTRCGPVVVEVPPSTPDVHLFGSAIDSWEVPLVDMGPAGLDQGRGGKYLFLPPGYLGAQCDGYFCVKSPTYFVHVALRPTLLGRGTQADAIAVSLQLKVYPLSRSLHPITRAVDGYPKPWHTLPVYDLTYFEDLASVVNDEPAQEKDAAMLGLLAGIGIEKGKAFRPTPDAVRAFEQAAHDAYGLMQEYVVTPGKGYRLAWPDRQWGGLRLSESEDFTFLEDGKLLVDERAATFFVATFLPKKLGKATAYLSAFRDAEGQLFDGSKRYRLRVPADVPAGAFWSLVAYSLETKAFIPNPRNRVGLSSYDKRAMRLNSDGSVDLYLSTAAPAGWEANWIPTEDEDFFLLFRLYGPERPFVDGSWKLADVERLT